MLFDFAFRAERRGTPKAMSLEVAAKAESRERVGLYMRRLIAIPILLGLALLILGILIIADGRTFNGACAIVSAVCFSTLRSVCAFLSRRCARAATSEVRQRKRRLRPGAVACRAEQKPRLVATRVGHGALG